MKYDFCIYPQISDAKINPSKSMAANAKIIDVAIGIDKLMTKSLDGGLHVQHVSSDLLHQIDIKLSHRNEILSGKDYEKLLRCLSKCKLCVFLHQPKMGNQHDFAELYKDLLRILGDAAKEHYKLIQPQIAIHKYELAKIVIKLSDVAELRISDTQYLYQDKQSSVDIKSPRKLTIADLLPVKNQTSDTHSAVFQIKTAPVDGLTDFKFSFEGENINHEMLDDEFMDRWDSGQTKICCHDRLKVLFEYCENSDPKKSVYKIIKVVGIIHRDNSEQESFDF
jgi:hypothetical protein